MITKLALFDLDNTLVDQVAAFSRWTAKFSEDLHLPEGSASFIEEADRDGMRPREPFFESVREAFGLNDSVDQLLARYEIDYPACFTIPDDTVASIRALRSQGWKVGLVTNGPPSQMRKQETIWFVDEVDGICVSEEVGAWKPDSEIFEEAARRCGAPLEGWMVGDSESADIAGGHRCGLRTIWMSRSRSWESTELVPDATVTTIPQAEALILADPALPG